MAARAGTNAGSTPEDAGVGVGDGDSLGEGVAEADGVGEGAAVGVLDAGGLTATVGVQPPRRVATATAAKPRVMRRNGIPTPPYTTSPLPWGMHRGENLLPYALGR
jgi:hypothetical protein